MKRWRGDCGQCRLIGPGTPARFAWYRMILSALCVAISVVSAGCNIIAYPVLAFDNYRRTGTHTVAPEYTGLAGKNWAVVVIADRSIQAELPDLVPWMTGKICERLASQQDKIGAAGMIPPERVLRYQSDHPSWTSMPFGELAGALTVDRLIVVEIIEYRLNDPGNQYLWAGLATGTVRVVEAGSSIPDEFALEKTIRVKFPDEDNYGPSDFDRATVTTRLATRFLDRATWLFYSHDEPNEPKY